MDTVRERDRKLRDREGRERRGRRANKNDRQEVLAGSPV